MGIYIYKENPGTGLVFIDSDIKPAKNTVIQTVNGAPTTNVNFVLLETVTEISATSPHQDYKTWRDGIKTAVIDAGGFGSLSPSEQIIAATHNIGTGAEIAAAIPDLTARDETSIQYLKNMKGHANGVRPFRAILLEAKTWSRCKKNLMEVAPGVWVTMPEVLYNAITINTVNAPGEMSGNLLVLYVAAGVLGYAGGDKSLGILDFLLSTVGTRFENAGFIETFTGQAIDGFAALADFRDWLVDVLLIGTVDQIT